MSIISESEKQIEEFSKTAAEENTSAEQFSFQIRKGRYVEFNPNLFIERFLETMDCC